MPLPQFPGGGFKTTFCGICSPTVTDCRCDEQEDGEARNVGRPRPLLNLADMTKHNLPSGRKEFAMLRFTLAASVAAAVLALAAVPDVRAQSHSGGPGFESHHGSEHFDYRFPNRDYHGFRASNSFGYNRYGFRSVYWNNYRWSSEYRCYLYWAPSYRSWCFYEPTYSYYVPVSYFSQVYPSAPPTVAPVPPPPSVIQQQTTVVTAPPVPISPASKPVPPAPIPPITSAPTAVQETKVAQGGP
jgi:hypothetical protein